MVIDESNYEKGRNAMMLAAFFTINFLRTLSLSAAKPLLGFMSIILKNKNVTKLFF